jgi:putative ABC transport system ATP-binding protein
MPGNTFALQTTDLRREYRMGREIIAALGGVDIHIQRDEFVAIMGPSGCGKSTLLNLLGGLDKPTSGSIWLDGQELSLLSEEELATLRRQKMGFIFQRHSLLPVLTARENVEFPMLLNDLEPVARRARAEKLLSLVGLSEKADSLPDELSGGQQQRVGIAGALANDAAILLADEPTGNLDSATSEDIINLLLDLRHTNNLTLVIVTHDPEIAARADRILYLKDGRLADKEGNTL